MKKAIGLCLIGLLYTATLLHADRGSISFKPHVKVFEPAQRAMIAWNGQEQILLLSTDLKASEATRVLEVIPFPSEPEVKKGDIEVFRKAISLINMKVRRLGTGTGKGLVRGRGEVPAGEVTFHQRIGAHDISVIRVLESEGFIGWVEGYLKADGVENPVIPEALKEVVAEYIQEGFEWFVFDVVSLDEVPRTIDAIQYRFKTDFLFYPLKIMRNEEGDTSITLLVLTPRLFAESDFIGLPAKQVLLLHPPVSLSSSELRTLSEEMDELLGRREDLKLRIWEIRGRLSAFTRDLMAK